MKGPLVRSEGRARDAARKSANGNAKRTTKVESVVVAFGPNSLRRTASPPRNATKTIGSIALRMIETIGRLPSGGRDSVDCLDVLDAKHRCRLRANLPAEIGIL